MIDSPFLDDAFKQLEVTMVFGQVEKVFEIRRICEMALDDLVDVVF